MKIQKRLAHVISNLNPPISKLYEYLPNLPWRFRLEYLNKILNDIHEISLILPETRQHSDLMITYKINVIKKNKLIKDSWLFLKNETPIQESIFMGINIKLNDIFINKNCQTSILSIYEKLYDHNYLLNIEPKILFKMFQKLNPINKEKTEMNLLDFITKESNEMPNGISFFHKLDIFYKIKKLNDNDQDWIRNLNIK
jgi:hypothetical protein